MSKSFAVTWDYCCPFARNAHEHLLSGLVGGADWDVRFLVFSLEQTHVEEGGRPVWDEPDRHPGLLANLAGVAVRERNQSVFVRLMNRPVGDTALATSTIDRVLDLVEGWPELNEFKHTVVLR